MLEIPLTPEVERLLADIAARVGEAPATLAQKALLAYLEDLEDYAIAVEAWKEHDPATTLSLEEAKRELGMEDELTPKALKQLNKLPRDISHRIVGTIERDLDRHNDPRAFGEAMIGNWTGFWRYRVGDYRAICRIEDEVVTVFVIEVAHRREVYR